MLLIGGPSFSTLRASRRHFCVHRRCQALLVLGSVERGGITEAGLFGLNEGFRSL
jgi:hypothetical protein